MAIYSGFTHQKWWCSIVMLVYQRVALQNGHVRDRKNEYPKKTDLKIIFPIKAVLKLGRLVVNHILWIYCLCALWVWLNVRNSPIYGILKCYGDFNREHCLWSVDHDGSGGQQILRTWPRGIFFVGGVSREQQSSTILHLASKSSSASESLSESFGVFDLNLLKLQSPEKSRLTV